MPQVDQVTYLPIVFWVTITYNVMFVFLLYTSFLQLTNISQMEVKLLENKSLKNFYYKKLFLTLIDSAFLQKTSLKHRFWKIGKLLAVFSEIKKLSLDEKKKKKIVENSNFRCRKMMITIDEIKHAEAHLSEKTANNLKNMELSS